MSKPKKRVKVLVHSNYTRLKTGFGKNMRNLFLALYNDPDIELIEAANGPRYGSDIKTPWKSYATYPVDYHVLKAIEGDGVKTRAAKYGFYTIDEIVEDCKPDVYLGIEDYWAFTQFETKEWYKDVKTIIWSTVDSLPLREDLLKVEEHCDQFICWSTFATEEMHRIGRDSVKTLHGAIDYNDFYELPDKKQRKIEAGLEDNFVIGFVFKNQLRKSVTNLLEGFALFKEKNPECKPKLLLHTDWKVDGRRWNIPKYIKEKGVDPKDVLTTYICDNCSKYHVRYYDGEGLECPYCGEKESRTKTVTTRFLKESELNEIYNLMDVYCHPFTSGGQELPIQEAKSAGLITLVTSYSCGLDSCFESQGGIPLDWSEYREISSQFVKATTDPKSIADKLDYVLNMSEVSKKAFKIAGQKNIKEKFSVDKTVFELKEIILNLKKKKIEDEDEEGGDKVIDESEKKSLESFLGDESPDDRILVVMPRSAGDVLMVNSLLENIKELYPDKFIYVSTNIQFRPMIEDNPNIYKMLPYSEMYNKVAAMEGARDHYGYFNILFTPNITTQRILGYTHNGADKNTLL